MKICNRCKIEQSLEKFSKNKRKKDGLQVACRSCVKTLNADYYKRTPERNPQRRASSNALRERNREYVLELLKKSSCIDCGQDDYRVLEFDHVRGTKLANVSKLALGGYLLETVKEEIAKCDIRCANCHRIKTGIDFNWYKTLN